MHLDINLLSILSEARCQKEQFLEDQFTFITLLLGDLQSRTVQQAKDVKISAWLNVLPDLSAQEFKDGLAIHYKKPLLGIPASCDGCGANFDLSHALSCRKEV